MSCIDYWPNGLAGYILVTETQAYLHLTEDDSSYKNITRFIGVFWL